MNSDNARNNLYNLHGKIALVTGGAGFIGSHLVDGLIVAGCRVVVIDDLSTGKREQVHSKAKFVRGDIRRKEITHFFRGIDYVFHLAARARIQPSIQDPVPAFKHNIMGTLSVLLAARDAKVKRVIFSASSSSYGDQSTLPLKEDMRPNVKNPYALTKLVGEGMCKLFCELYGLKTVSLRYFNVYGPRQLTEGAYATVIGIFLKQAQECKPLTIVGNGEIKRDFTHVYDVVRANLLAAVSDKVGGGEIINVGTGRSYSINQVAAMILQKNLPAELLQTIRDSFHTNREITNEILKMRRNYVEYIPPRPGETLVTLADNSLARELLEWNPPYVNLEDALPKLLRDY